jgi:diguanylate cyclase (GGDEF)-like protein
MIQPMHIAQTQAEQIRDNMRRVARRQGWLWSSAVLVTLLLTLGIASFAFPGLLSHAEDSSSFLMNQAIRGLVGLVLLFSVYTVYQQLQINRMQKQVSDQVEALGKMEERTEEVYKIAVLDPLTGLFNRRSGEQRLGVEIARCQRHGCPLTVLTLDLDGLKNVNDKFGHAAGDALIKYFSERLTKAIRGSDLAVRIGGDEFLLILPECKSEEVGRVLNRLDTMVFDYEGQQRTVRFSAGWTNYTTNDTHDQLLKRADDALYANKRANRQRSQAPLLVS